MTDEKNKGYDKTNPFALFIQQCSKQEGMIIITALAVVQYWLITLIGGGSYIDVFSGFNILIFPILVMALIIGFMLTVGTYHYVESLMSMRKLNLYKHLRVPAKIVFAAFIIMIFISLLGESGAFNFEYSILHKGDFPDGIYYSIIFIGILSAGLANAPSSEKELPLAFLVTVFCLGCAIAFYASVYQESKNNSFANDAKYCYWLYLVADSQPHVTKKPDPTCLRIGITTRSKPLHLID